MVLHLLHALRVRGSNLQATGKEKLRIKLGEKILNDKKMLSLEICSSYFYSQDCLIPFLDLPLWQPCFSLLVGQFLWEKL